MTTQVWIAFWQSPLWTELPAILGGLAVLMGPSAIGAIWGAKTAAAAAASAKQAVNLGQQNAETLKAVGDDAKAAKELTAQGNVSVADTKAAVNDAKAALEAHAEQLEEVRKDVNSGTERATDAAKTAADKSEDLSVQLATLVAEKAAALRAADVALNAAQLAERGRDEALRLKTASDAEITELRRKLADRGNG